MTTDPITPGNGTKNTVAKSFVKTLLPVVGILGAVILTLSIVKSYVARQPTPPGRVEVKIGATLPDFTVKQFGSGETKASAFKSKVTLLNFWATWCEACILEMPSIVRLRNRYKDRGFEVVAINVDEAPDAVLPKAIKQLHLDFPVFTDVDNRLSDIFDVHAIPLTVIMDANRKILFVESGERDWDGEDLRKQLDGWLSG